MNSRTTSQFRKLFTALPADAKRQARAAYTLFTNDFRHNSLNFKPADPSQPELYSVRIGAHYRAIGALNGDTMTWTWIGTHEQYNLQVKRR